MRNLAPITIILLTLLLGLTGCDKQKRAGKKLAGDWELVSIYKTDWDGMTEYPSTFSGTFSFDDYDADSSNYTLKITADFNSSNGNYDQHGTYKMTDKGDYMYISTLDSNGLLTSYIKYRILMLNSTDLQIEFTSVDAYYHMMIFRRKK
jgi:hypothetical protein